MRPRQACLGMAWDGFSKQWRRITCFNEAEASLPRNGCLKVYLSSWVSHASMRPRQACLGMAWHSLLMAIQEGDASMRPRQACLGMELPSISLCDLAYFEVLRALDFVASKKTENFFGRLPEGSASPYSIRQNTRCEHCPAFRVYQSTREQFGTSGARQL